MIKIKKCRSCKNKNFDKILSLGKQYFTGIFLPKKNSKIPNGPLNLIKCKTCDLLQLEHDFDQKKCMD